MVSSRAPGRLPRAIASAHIAPITVESTTTITATCSESHSAFMNSALREEFDEPAQRDADRRKRDVGRRVEREDDHDRDRQQQERDDRAVERQIGGVPCVEAPAHAICLSPVSRPRIVL